MVESTSRKELNVKPMRIDRSQVSRWNLPKKKKKKLFNRFKEMQQQTNGGGVVNFNWSL